MLIRVRMRTCDGCAPSGFSSGGSSSKRMRYVFSDDSKRVAVMLIDFYRYDKATQRAAELAKQRGHEVHVLADSFCLWAHKTTDSVFNLPTSTGLYWHSTAAMSVLLNLLVNDVIRALGKAVPKRIAGVLRSQKVFDQFAEDL